MSIITLLTDFGTKDIYVGTMKGAILSINPQATIVDITHAISPQDLIQAAYTLSAAYRYFPEGTIHIVVVDPGVGSDRPILAVKTKKHIFLAPDNGVVSIILEKEKTESILHVNNADFFLETISNTFHGRDIFAPIAAHLSRGIPFEKIGTSVNEARIVRLNIPSPKATSEGELQGEIITIDHFGNLITNIDPQMIEKVLEEKPSGDWQVTIGSYQISGLSKSYVAVPPQTPLAIMGSSGYLEVALNCGSAMSYFRAKKGDAVRLKRKE